MPRLSYLLCPSLVFALGACSLELRGTGPADAALATGRVDAGRAGGASDAASGTQPSESSEVEPSDATAERLAEADAGARAQDGAVATGLDAALPSSLPEAGLSATPDAARGCALAGRFAFEIAFDVTWVGTQFASIVPVISPGAGKLRFVVIGDLSAAGATSEVSLRTCQASVPEFISTLPQERYAVHFANAMWDSPGMPTFKGVITSCSEAPCALKSTAFHALIGSALGEPDASWPTSIARGDWPDHDGDGRPGIAARMLGPEDNVRFTYPPADLLAFRRVQKLDLGLRVNVTLSGQRDSCDALSGRALGGSVDTRALGCTATARPIRCNADELQFLDDNLPAWTVREGTFRGVQLKDNAGCDEARQMFGFKEPGPG